jgi:hypothetical protein
MTRILTHLELFELLYFFAYITVILFCIHHSPFTMERLFSPCNRFYERIEELEYFTDYDGYILETTRELSTDVSTEELLSAERAFTYADLYALLGKELDGGITFAWVTQPAVVMLANGRELYCPSIC